MGLVVAGAMAGMAGAASAQYYYYDGYDPYPAYGYGYGYRYDYGYAPRPPAVVPRAPARVGLPDVRARRLIRRELLRAREADAVGIDARVAAGEFFGQAA